MYTPTHFAANHPDALIERLARAAAGVVITIGEDGFPVGTHTPIVWDRERRVVSGHIARANPQWTVGATRALIVLRGPEAYVSPTWYPSKAEHGKAVPTWNYEAVHFTGALDWFEDAPRLEALLRALTGLHESGRPEPWSIDDAPRAYIDAMLRGIVGFEMRAERVEAKRKLSQNKGEADFNGVVEGLASEDDSMAHDVAALMRALRS